MRVLRIYHAGRNAAHRARDRALSEAGVEVVLVVPSHWSDEGSQADLDEEPFEIFQLPVARPGDVNRHVYGGDLGALVQSVRPDLVDIHEEPVSLVMRQALRAIGADLRAVSYTAQNLDKRFPPPFAQYERAAYSRLAGIYPCTRQAAAVIAGKGFAGEIEVLPLGLDPNVHYPAERPPDSDPTSEALVVLAGRMVPEKGVLDAVRAVSLANRHRRTRLHLVGDGPALGEALQAARALDIAHRVTASPWLPTADLAELLRQAQVALIPSMSSHTWVEQFGRAATEAQSCGAVVVGYASGSLPEVVATDGLLVPPGRSDLLGHALAKVLLNESEWLRLRTAGLTTACQGSWQRVAEQQAAFYERVMAGPVSTPVQRPRREQAQETWGKPAHLEISRPFADPLLRRVGPAQRPIGSLVDSAVGVGYRLSDRVFGERPSQIG